MIGCLYTLVHQQLKLFIILHFPIEITSMHTHAACELHYWQSMDAMQLLWQSADLLHVTCAHPHSPQLAEGKFDRFIVSMICCD